MAAIAVVSAAGAAKAVVMLEQMRRDTPPRAAVMHADPAIATLAGAPSAAQVVKASDGHYWAEASVNGSRVKFLVDTGATAVALTIADAKRLGIQPDGLDYDASVMTASGRTRAAMVQLASVAIGGTRVENVDALVIESGLETSLLGMSYLGRLSRFEATPQALILRQ